MLMVDEVADMGPSRNCTGTINYPTTRAVNQADAIDKPNKPTRNILNDPEDTGVLGPLGVRVAGRGRCWYVLVRRSTTNAFLLSDAFATLVPAHICQSPPKQRWKKPSTEVRRCRNESFDFDRLPHFGRLSILIKSVLVCEFCRERSR